MKYGGDLQKELAKLAPPCEEQLEFKSISTKYLNELFSHRDEYQQMFEEYFQVRVFFLTFHC